MLEALPERVRQRIARNAETGCWEWTATKIHNGYAVLTIFSRQHLVHRLLWEWANRRPFPSGLEADHLCRVRHCVNPDHIEPVTALENNHRRVLVAKTHCPKGHPYSEENTRFTRGGYKTCRTCERVRCRNYQRRRRAANV